MHLQSLRFKVMVSLGIVALAVGPGAYSYFSATTANAGDQIQSGTVSVSDSDGGTGKLALLTGSNAPLATQSKCVRVSYGGDLAASIKLYRGSVNAGANGRYQLLVEKATTGTITAPAADMNCTGVSAWGTVFTAADLDTLGTTWAAGTDIKGSAFAGAETMDLRFTVTVNDGTTVNGNTTNNDTGLFDLTFEARS